MRKNVTALLAWCLLTSAQAADAPPQNVASAPANPPPAAAPNAPAAAPQAEAEWQKFETKLTQFNNVRQMLTPGVLDPELQHIVTVPKDGSAVDLGLPHFGKDKSGKNYPAIMAKFAQGGVWVDLNGDGAPNNGETSVFGDDEYSEAFTTELHYEDGASGQYSFKLKTVVDKEKYAVVRCCARTFDFKSQKIVLLDDDGDGKYDDVDRDCVVVGNNPVTFLGKYIAVGDEFYEILVHAGGANVDIRKAPKMELGLVKMMDAFKLPQKSEDLKIDTVIIKSADSSFSFDDKHPSAKVPVGAYDMVFGIFERKAECVYAKKGDKTSFTVNAGDANTLPKYASKITAQVECDSDGWDVFIHKPKFVGEAGEQYSAENYKVVAVWAYLAQVYYDTAMKLELLQDIGNGRRRFTVLPDGDLKDVVIRHFREKNEEYQASVEYDSGIMGKVTGKTRLQFVFKKKDKTAEKDKAKSVDGEKK